MNQAENFQTSIKVARSKKSSSRISLTTINTEAWRASLTVGTTHLTLALKQHRRGSSCIQTRSPKTTTKSIRLKTTRTIPMQLQELCWARTLKCSRWLTRDRAWIRFWTKEPLVCLRHQTLRFLRIPSTLPRSWQLPTLLARKLTLWTAQRKRWTLLAHCKTFTQDTHPALKTCQRIT